MKPSVLKNMTAAPPLIRITSMAGFAALSNACSFAQSIFEKYSRSDDEYTGSEAFVFLNSINKLLQTGNEQRKDLSQAIRLVIIRQLIISGELKAPRAVFETAENELQTIKMKLRNSDSTSWKQLVRIQSLLSEKSSLSSFIIKAESRHESTLEMFSSIDLKAILNEAGVFNGAAGAASMMLPVIRASAESEPDFSSEKEGLEYPAGENLVLRNETAAETTDRQDITSGGEIRADEVRDSAESIKSSAQTAEGQTYTEGQTKAPAIEADSKGLTYPNSESLVLRNEDRKSVV